MVEKSEEKYIIVMMNNIKKQVFKLNKALGAMFGAACGDAIGWPNERINKSKYTQIPKSNLYEFKQWSRYAGGRFYPHNETIAAGEYSDDTQLILCTSRSLLYGNKWFDHFTKIELPFWTLYERGGGGATKRACNVWGNGRSPWAHDNKSDEKKKYYNAGGNGVAMRILPHILYLNNQNDFSTIAKNIIMDGITTHGHPRAILGALAYGYALWVLLNKHNKLDYGELIDKMLLDIDTWSKLQESPFLINEWINAANTYNTSYENIWNSTIKELEEYLFICKDEINKGALIVDDEVLKKLNCFDYKMNGAGTVAAITAIYFSSRYAPNPMSGLIKAATTLGTDTDTIASMTGALLGLINGCDWLSPLSTKLQDAKYIEHITNNLCSGIILEDNINKDFQFPDLKNWVDKMINSSANSNITLPDKRPAVIKSISEQIGKSKNYKVEFRKLFCEDGQTIYIKKISKVKFIPNNTHKNNNSEQLSLNLMKFGIKINTASFEILTTFYSEGLGLKIKNKTKETIVFEDGLVLVSDSYVNKFADNKLKSLIYVEVANIDKIYKWATNKNINIITPIGLWSKSGKSQRRFFRCNDPNGNIVEVFSIN